MTDMPTTSSGVSRRNLLRVASAASAAVGLSAGLSDAAHALPPAGAKVAGDERYWASIRRMFPLDPKNLFLNVGTVGIPPKAVIEAVHLEMRRVAFEADSGYSSFDDVRARLAKGLGADMDEIAITRNTTDGIGKIFAGLDLKSGDEILTTNHEHPAGWSSMWMLRDRYGVSLKEVTLPQGNKQRAEDYVELFSRAITSRTKLVYFSAPTYKTGTLLPISLLGKLAQEKGIPTFVDGAHLPGMMNLHFRDLGVDFIAGSLAKWQCGPPGLGVVYIRNKRTSANSTPLPRLWPVISMAYLHDALAPRDWSSTAGYDIGRLLTVAGNTSLPDIAGLDEACQLWDRIGRQRIHEYSNGLSAHLKELVAERFGVDSLCSPKDDVRLTCAITSFNPCVTPSQVADKAKTDAIVARLKSDHGITIRNVDVPVGESSGAKQYPLRVSTHIWHTKEDVERFVDACWKVSRAVG